MSFPVISLSGETTLGECCKTMEFNKIRRMVVVDGTGACCGIVGQADIARTASMLEAAGLVKEISIAHQIVAGKQFKSD